MVTCTLMRQLQSSFRFSSCKSGSWRRYALDFLCWCVDGEVEELVQLGRGGGGKWQISWGLLCGTWGRGKLCMMPWQICHIYGIWRSKEVWRRFKVIIWGGKQATRQQLLWRREFSLFNTAVLKLYCKFCWVLWKI